MKSTSNSCSILLAKRKGRKMENNNFVFDSYALLCFFKKEPGYDKVKALLKKAEQKEVDIFLSAVNFAEVYYSVYRLFGKEIANKIIGILYTFHISIVDVNIQLTLAAAKIKANNPIALGDRFAIGLTKLKNASIITGDPEYKIVENEIDIIWLPYK